MNEIAKREESALTIPAELTVDQMVAQVQKIQQLMASVMKKDEHYGVIPGTDKPSLLQPGAQKLNFVFRLGDRNTQITTKELPNNHREYLVTLDIVHIPTGLTMSQGVGSCSTMESKYRYRNIADYEDTGLPIPADSKEHKSEYRKQGFGMKKISGTWAWVRYKDSSRVENPDIADTYNTVLKMANKRAYIHGTIKATAASDLFTQDLEDFSKDEGHHEEEEQHGTGDNGKKAPGIPAEEIEFLKDDLLAYLDNSKGVIAEDAANKLREAVARREKEDPPQKFAEFLKKALAATIEEVKKQEALLAANAGGVHPAFAPAIAEVKNPMAAAVEKLAQAAKESGKVPAAEKPGELYDHE